MINKLNLISLAVAMALSAQSARVQALGLSQANTSGVLNRPLNIELPIIAEANVLHDIHARLADPEQHQRFGLDYPDWLPKLNVNAVNSDNGPVLQVTTFNPVKEPIVNFVLEVKYQKMVLFKEITLFLDPISIVETRNESSKQASRQTGAIASQSTTSTTPSTLSLNNRRINPAQQTSTTKYHGNGEHSFRVAAGQSLWRIAKAWQVNGASQAQKMDAIFYQNQHAFIKGDRNRLMQGAKLTFNPGHIDAPRTLIAMPSTTSSGASTAKQSTPQAETTTTLSTPTVQALTEFKAAPESIAATQTVAQKQAPSASTAQTSLSASQQLVAQNRLDSLNQSIVQQQQLNQSLKVQLALLEQKIVQLEQLRQSELLINKTETTSATPAISSTPVLTMSNANSAGVTNISTPLAVTQVVPGSGSLMADSAASDADSTTPQSSSINSESPSNTGSIWLTAIWVVLALIIGYLGTVLSNKRKARVFAQNLDHKLSDMNYENIQQKNSHMPSIQDLSIPHNVSPSVQIKYLQSAADFYIRCHRFDLAKELVNEGLIQFSGNTQLIRELNEIRKNIVAHLDHDLHDDINHKLEEREVGEKEIADDSDILSIEDINKQWVTQFNKKVS